MDALVESWLESLRAAIPQTWSVSSTVIDVWWARGEKDRALGWVRSLGPHRKGPALARFAALEPDTNRSVSLAREALASPYHPNTELTIPVSDQQVFAIASQVVHRRRRRGTLSWNQIRSVELELPPIEELMAAAQSEPEFVARAASRFQGEARSQLLAAPWRSTQIQCLPAMLLATKDCGDWSFVPETALQDAVRIAALARDSAALERLLGQEPSALLLANATIGLGAPRAE